MNFIPAATPTYFAPAEYKRHNEDGTIFVFPFDCQFARLTKEQMRELDESTAKVRVAGGDPDAHRLASLCKGWRFKEGEGEAAITKHVEYSATAIATLENANPGFMATCVRAYYLSLAAQEPAHHAAKN